MKKKILFLWALLMGFFVPTHAQTWTWVGETPTAGYFYIRSNVNNVFIKATSTVDSNPANATLFTLSAATNCTISYQDNGTKYVYESAGNQAWGTTNTNKWTIANQNNNNQYFISHSDPATRNRTRYIQVSNTTINYPYQNFTGDNRLLVFISEAQMSSYNTHFNNYESAYNEVKTKYPSLDLLNELGTTNYNDVESKIKRLNQILENGVFNNPLTQQDAADPSVILADDGYYYLYSSEAYSGQGIPVWRSADMVNWTFLTTIFKNRPANVDYTYLWAPEVAKVGDKYVLYYANAAWGNQASTQICVATSDNPYGPFENNKILIHASGLNDGYNANVDNVIDPSLFRDTDGKNYLIWGSWKGVYYIELDANCTSLASGATKKSLVNGSNGDWEKIEAPMLIKRGGYYYLIASKGATVNESNASGINYQLVMARSTSLGGTFNDIDGNTAFGNHGGFLGMGQTTGSMSNLLQGNDYVLGPGHCSQIITDKNGTEWIFYHGYSKNSDGSWDYPGARKLFVSPVLWGNWTPEWPGILPPSANPIEMPSVTAQSVEYPDVYSISSADDLMTFANNACNGMTWINAQLENDIDMNGKTWTPIGNETCKFQGTIDGQNHKIMNLTINRPDVDRQGLIGTADDGVRIKNLIIDKTCSIIGGNYTGAFIGRIDGNGDKHIYFENCGNEAYVKGGKNTAGFVGCDTGVSLFFENCYNMGNIDGDNESAAFSGWGIDLLKNCWNTGSIKNMELKKDGKGHYYSIARDWNDSKSVNTYDLNADNAPLDVNRLEGYDPSWLANGHLAYVMNQNARENVWYQNVDEDLVKDEHPVFLNDHKVVNYDGFAYYNENRIAEYTRNVTSGNFGTICLPYASTSYEGAKFYNVAGTKHNANGELTALALEEVEGDLEAGKPYIFRATNSTLRVKYNLDEVCKESHPATYGLVGNLSTSVLYVPVYDYLISQNKFYRMIEEEQGSINQYRAYITLKNVEEYNPSSSSKAVIFGLDGTISEGVTTGINEIESNGSDVYFNVAGQRVGLNAKGLVIKNGKKYILK